MSDDAQNTKLSPQRWARVKVVFEQALEVSETERARFVQRQCGEDAVLRAEVMHLLRSYSEAGEFLEEKEENTQTGSGLLRGAASSRPDAWVGAILRERYRIQRRLGAGGLGTVYLAEDLTLNRPVVVKFLHDYDQPDPARLRKFRQEIEALARIDHPGVVTAFDAGETIDSRPFLVMQYIEGQTLRVLIDAGPVALDRAESILRQLGEALQAAHDKRIIHRDLKPENIMLQRLGSRDIVKLIDFGIARVEESRAGGETAILTVAGTPSYMAPEQLSGRPVLASDIFALGVIAYEMVTGRRPFPSKHPYQLRQQHKAGVPSGALRRLRPAVPASAEAGIRRALAFSPADRPIHAKEWCDQVASALLAQNSSLPRRSILYGIAGLFTAVLASLLMWWGLQRRRVMSIRGPLLASHKGASNPVDEGFQLGPGIEGFPQRNAEHTGFDRWRLRAREQGSYFAPLTDAEKQSALRRGWKITFSGYPDIGGIHAVADFHGFGQRFDISMFREPDGRLKLMTCTQHVPFFAGPEFELSNQPHTCELVYDPVNAACTLSVDGTRLLSGYQGHSQQQGERGFFFGASVWKSDHAEGTVDSVRFELL